MAGLQSFLLERFAIFRVLHGLTVLPEKFGSKVRNLFSNTKKILGENNYD